MGRGGERETLHCKMIFLNVIYSTFILAAALLGCIATWTYQWIEAKEQDMITKANIAIPANVPGLNKVSCGLLTYCIDAAGEVSECSLPWPRYGGNDGDPPTPSEAPIMLWNVTAGFCMAAVILLGIAWLYTLISCFGCYTTWRQRTSACMVTASGWFFVIALLVFGASFNDVAVKDCADGLKNADGSCVRYEPVFPSARIEGGGGNIGCRICAKDMDRYVMSDSCELGWGGFVVIGAFLMTLVASCIGYSIHSRPTKVTPTPFRQSDTSESSV